MTRVKICGITRIADALAACAAGADAIGVVFAASRRRVDTALARQIAETVTPFVPLVGVFMDQPIDEIEQLAREVPLDMVQLHGDEPVDVCRRLTRRWIKRVSVDSDGSAESLVRRASVYAGASAILLDPGAGDGRAFDWSLASAIPRSRLVVAGGLTPDNVAAVVRALRPAGVDVSSGVELAPGVKDESRMRAFIQNVRVADADVA